MFLSDKSRSAGSCMGSDNNYMQWLYNFTDRQDLIERRIRFQRAASAWNKTFECRCIVEKEQ
ncbi:hypothetical protein T03_3292 [Trichinella britovi]|uniref:Uncharacterized protein n=1 Tax=Trichinella britovi TaxID=45882 RepID=A0A0V1CMU2_TRIBR|nr:hypothetical protein T03_3292 [Trichinella britovi]